MSGDSVIWTPSTEAEPLRQGEILSDVVQPLITVTSIAAGGEPQLALLRHPLTVIISQDCDLDLEYKARHQIPNAGGKVQRRETQIQNILFCDVFPVDQLKVRFEISRDIMRRIESNSDERYQYLRAVASTEDAAGEGLPTLAIDFKRYFTVSVDEIYERLGRETRRRSRLSSPYLEHLSARFARYLARIALPTDH